MGQYWEIISIDNRETTGHLGKLGEFFWMPEDSLVSCLTTPVIPSSYKTDSAIGVFEGKSQKHKKNYPPSILLSLPHELLLVIAEELLEKYLDLICFSLTCIDTWELTEQVRYKSLSQEIKRKSWAGSRMILLGDYAGALPKGLLTDAEKKELRLDGYADHELGSLLYAHKAFGKPSYKIPSGLYYDAMVQDNDLLLDELRYFGRRKPFSQWIRLPGNFKLTKSSSSKDLWMVRNLTKQEYVIPTRPQSLTQVVYSLIGCSDDASVSMQGERCSVLINGPWAGDRIDITLVSIHRQEHAHEEGSSWKDITVSVKELLEALATEDDDYGVFKF
ncbi:hypothetical protein F5876DRAFT_76484 [Lentinula aff. lateritia]|uniref:Uncharacterized protein n=1 Tax=Lentinula aff. lateritia TaxID=2804960 RepID=A0ACC1U221_9AGAR|nr:hypothetical protein F5876DRAFT_76484 [Lentinula aff. lateritia]